MWKEVEHVLLNPEIIATEVERRKVGDPFGKDLESLDHRQRLLEHQQKQLARAVATLEDEETAAPLLAELKQLGAEAKALRVEQD